MAAYDEDLENSKVLLVLRIKGDTQTPDQAKRLLNSLRLHKIHSADVFQMTEKLRQALKLVAPYVIYGRVSKDVLSKILKQRGFAIVNKEYKAISNEEIIETGLGHLDIVCVQDLGKCFFFYINFYFIEIDNF